MCMFSRGQFRIHRRVFWLVFPLNLQLCLNIIFLQSCFWKHFRKHLINTPHSPFEQILLSNLIWMKFFQCEILECHIKNVYNLRQNNKLNIQGPTPHKQNITGTLEGSIASSPWPPSPQVIHYLEFCINYSLIFLYTYLTIDGCMFLYICACMYI